ncbi:MAG TPA: hypothetical protein VJR02_15075 [Pyrinomonadaceae bacterium]|nr:hypothetical protein [Pyrinomonadaceae bacterium]
MTSPSTRPTARQLLVAVICFVIVLGGAFLAASLTQEKEIFSLSPPAEKNALADVQVPPDIRETQRLDLHRTFFTAWAAIILVTPALCTFLFRRSSRSAAGYWLAFWTVSFIAFLIHFYWAVAVIFSSDWCRIFNTTRVSAALPDLIFTFWWGLDVVRAWFVQSEERFIRIERALVHLFAFVLFFAGSALEGEIWWSKALGFAMATAVLIAFLIWLIRWLKSRKPTVAHACI